MENNVLRNEYRCINDGEKTKWKQLTSIGEFIWDGVYAMRLVTNDSSLGLPFKFSGEEVVNLFVKDQFPDNHIQNNRIIVQTLTRVERSTGHVQTYIRTRRYNNGEHKWDEWTTDNSGVAAGSSVVVDNDINTESTNPVQNKAIAQALEDAVARGRELAKRDLYVSAGALYNDTDEVIKRTAFWGEEVDHLPHHYYLNGLGNITELQMATIFNNNYLSMFLCFSVTNVFNNSSLRTTPLLKTRLPIISFMSNQNGIFHYSGIEVVKVLNGSSWGEAMLVGSLLGFNNATKLKVIDTLDCKNIKSSTIISNVVNLLHFRFKNLSTNLSLPNSAKISKESIVYLIQNSANTSVITISLHPNLYLRLMEDVDILTVLEENPLISLVSV